ncbi:protein-arginine deiminase type-2 isoform X2 [Ascaphus truei]
MQANNNPNNIQVSPPNKFKRPSVFYPKHVKGNFIETFTELVIQDLEKATSEFKFDKHNLTKIEIDAVKSLESNTQIVIKGADKGGGIVIMDSAYYKKESMRILSDPTTYQKLPGNPTAKFKLALNKYLDKGFTDGIITKGELEFLDIEQPRIPIFYFIPKIHKDLWNPPGRPIISGIKSMTSNLSQFIDSALQKYVSQIPSYLRDTTHVLNIVNDLKWEDHFIWVTCDVTSLYTVINHDQGVEAIRRVLEQDDSLESGFREFIIEGIRYILTHNFFNYDNEYYLQVCGTAMGTRFAPSYANIFMGMWEENYIHSNSPFGADLALWRRYIDDVLCIWGGNEVDLGKFQQYLNNNNMNLKFTFNINPLTIDFLDLTLFIENGLIETKTFYKKVDANTYLLASSNHNPRWINNIPKGQFLRTKRNCSQEAIFNTQANELKTKFFEREYNHNRVKKALEAAKNTNREELIQMNKKTIIKKDGVEFIPFITKYNGMANKITTIIKKHWSILLGDVKLKNILPQHPQIVFKKADNLKLKLSPSCPFNQVKSRNTTWLKELNGYFLCNKCIGCKYGQKCKDFKSNITGISFPIRSFITCRSPFVVYLLECPCGLQYVGRTGRPLKRRLAEHVFNIKRGLETHSVSNHFRLKHGQNPAGLICKGIECPKQNWRGGDKINLISRRESFWIYTLKTLTPKGLNIEFDLASFLKNG